MRDVHVLTTKPEYNAPNDERELDRLGMFQALSPVVVLRSLLVVGVVEPVVGLRREKGKDGTGCERTSFRSEY